MEKTRITPPSTTFAFSSSFHFQSCPHTFILPVCPCAIVPFRAAHAAKYQDSVRNGDEHTMNQIRNESMFVFGHIRQPPVNVLRVHTCLGLKIRTVAGNKILELRSHSPQHKPKQSWLFFAFAAASFTHSWRRQECSVGIHLDERPTFEMHKWLA